MKWHSVSAEVPVRSQGRHQKAGSFSRELFRVAGLVVSVLMVVAGLGIAGRIGWFYWRSHTVGAALLHREKASIRDAKGSAGGSGSPSCTATKSGPASTGTVAPIGILRASTIGLQAPVVEGVGNPELNVAVGHVPASVLPGQMGASVLTAHDVSWFSQINHLHEGDMLTYADACGTYRYQVIREAEVKAGSPIYSTLVPTLSLVTCYPLNALFLTPNRYVVTSQLVGVVPNAHAGTPATQPVLAPALVVPAPAALQSQGLTLSTNDAPLGTLSFAGSPETSVTQSPVPMQIESSVLSLYFAALRSAEQHQPGWWAAVAPGVPYAAATPLVGAAIAHNDASISPVLDFNGPTFTGATLMSRPVLAGGSRPGEYRVVMTAVVQGRALVVSGWQMTYLGA